MNKLENPAAKEFLIKINAVIDKTDELTMICPYVKNYSSIKQLRILAKRLEELPEKELAEAHKAFNDIDAWDQLSGSIDDVIVKVKTAVAPRSSQLPKIEVLQTDCSLGDCPNGPSQVQVDNLLIAVAAAELATAVAQATADTLAIFVITALAAKIAQAIASGLDVVAKSLALAAAVQQRAADVVAECEEDAVKRLLVNMCNTIVKIDKKIDIVIAELEVIDKKLDYLIELAKEIKAIVEEILLHQIEDALSSCKMLVALYLPEYASGSIEKVQSIVEKLIIFSKNAGRTVANADSYWRQGSVALSKGDYEKALQWFMLSYKQLQDKDPCSVPCPSDPCRQNPSSCKPQE